MSLQRYACTNEPPPELVEKRGIHFLSQGLPYNSCITGTMKDTTIFVGTKNMRVKTIIFWTVINHELVKRLGLILALTFHIENNKHIPISPQKPSTAIRHACKSICIAKANLWFLVFTKDLKKEHHLVKKRARAVMGAVDTLRSESREHTLQKRHL